MGNIVIPETDSFEERTGEGTQKKKPNKKTPKKNQTKKNSLKKKIYLYN